MRKFAFSTVLLVGSSALALSAGAAYAQTISLEEVVVTAERTPKDLQRSAASVTVRNGESLLNQGKYSLANIIEDVPGMSGGAAQAPAGLGVSPTGADSPAAGLTIRGIPSNVGVGGSSVSTATSAAIYVDGVYSGIGGDYDIDRVEVLRGPQGTLYGRSATSGVVTIHTRNPDTSDFGGQVAIEGGSYGLRHYTGAVNAPLSKDKLAVRLSGDYYERDGYNSKEGGAVANSNLRGKLLYTPSDSVSVLLGAAYQKNKLHLGGANFTMTSPDAWIETPSAIGSGENSFHQYWAELNWDLGWADLTYQPAYRSWKSNAVSYLRLPGLVGSDQMHSTPKDTFHTEELRLASKSGGPLTWQGGVLYYKNELENEASSYNDLSGAVQFLSRTEKQTTAMGGFAEATYAFTPSWRVTGGLRYDYTKIETAQDYTSNLTPAIFPGPTTGLPQNLVTQSLSGPAGVREFYNTTYRLRLEHDLTPQNMIYAVTSTAFSPGDAMVTTGPTLAPVALIFDSETLTAYEIGSKNRFLDNRLQVNGAVFFYDYEGYQNANVNLAEAGLAFGTVSAPAEAAGAELEILYKLTPRDRIGFNISHTHAYFVDRESQPIPGVPGKTFATFFAKAALPNVVPLAANLSYDHDADLPGGSRLNVHADLRYIGEYDSGRLTATTLFAAAYVRTDPEYVGNLSATWTSPDDRFTVTGYVRNVTDNVYKTNVGINTLGPFVSVSTTPSDPRTYGVVLAAKF